MAVIGHFALDVVTDDRLELLKEFRLVFDEEITGTDTPRRSKPADFGGGESTGLTRSPRRVRALR